MKPLLKPFANVIKPIRYVYKVVSFEKSFFDWSLEFRGSENVKIQLGRPLFLSSAFMFYFFMSSHLLRPPPYLLVRCFKDALKCKEVVLFRNLWVLAVFCFPAARKVFTGISFFHRISGDFWDVQTSRFGISSAFRPATPI